MTPEILSITPFVYEIAKVHKGEVSMSWEKIGLDGLQPLLESFSQNLSNHFNKPMFVIPTGSVVYYRLLHELSGIQLPYKGIIDDIDTITVTDQVNLSPEEYKNELYGINCEFSEAVSQGLNLHTCIIANLTAYPVTYAQKTRYLVESETGNISLRRLADVCRIVANRARIFKLTSDLYYDFEQEFEFAKASYSHLLEETQSHISSSLIPFVSLQTLGMEANTLTDIFNHFSRISLMPITEKHISRVIGIRNTDISNSSCQLEQAKEKLLTNGISVDH